MIEKENQRNVRQTANWLKQHPDIQIQYSKYKQISETYDICDYYWFMSWEEYQKYGWGTYRDWYQRYKAK